MDTQPFRLLRALFRAARGLPPCAVRSKEVHVSICKKEPPRVSLFQGIMESAPLASPDLEPVELPGATVPAAVDAPAGATAARVSGFLRLEVDRQKKATGSFLLFSDGRVLTGTVEGVASDGLGGHVETSFRLPPVTARKLGAGQTVPVAVRCLRFQGYDH